MFFKSTRKINQHRQTSSGTITPMTEYSLEKLPQKIIAAELTLELLRYRHINEFYQITNTPEIANTISFLSYPVDEDFPKNWIQKNYGIKDRIYGVFKNDELIGHIAAHLSQKNNVELGYWVSKKHTGKGTASKALKTIIETINSTYPAYLIFAECLPENKRSLKVLEKNGLKPSKEPAKKEGQIRLEKI